MKNDIKKTKAHQKYEPTAYDFGELLLAILGALALITALSVFHV